MGIQRKLGPIDIGTIEYETPFENIDKSPYMMDKYRNWYPKKEKNKNKTTTKPKPQKLKRSTSLMMSKTNESPKHNDLKIKRNSKHQKNATLSSLDKKQN